MKNFNDPDNAALCKGEALLLAARVKECKAAELLRDLMSSTGGKITQDEVAAALSTLKEHWHLIPVSLKAKLAERSTTMAMQTLVENGDPDVSNQICRVIMPSTDVEEAEFDGADPTMYAACAELFYQINEKFDTDALQDEPTAEESVYRKECQAILVVGLGAIWTYDTVTFEKNRIELETMMMYDIYDRDS